MAKQWLKNCPTANPQVQAFSAFWFLRHCLRYDEVLTSGAWPSEDAADADGVVVTAAPQEFTTTNAHFAVGDVGKLLAVYDPAEVRNTGIFPIAAFTDPSTITLGGACDWQSDAVDLEWVMFDPALAPALDEWAVVTPSVSGYDFEVWLSPRSAPHAGLAFQVGPTGGWVDTVTGPIPGGIPDGDMELGGTANWTPGGAAAVAKSVVQVQSGVRSLMIQSFGLGSVDSAPFNGTIDGQNYDVTLWVYNASGQPLNVTLWDGAGWQVYPPMPGPPAWTPYTLNFTKLAGTPAYLQFVTAPFVPINTLFLDTVELVSTTPAHFSEPATNYVNLDPASTTLFACGDDDHCFFWDEGGASRAGAYVGNFEPLHPPPSVTSEGDSHPSCVLGVDNAAPVLNRATAPVTSFAQGGSALFSDNTTVVTCYLNEWQTSDATATDVFGDVNYLTNPRTTTGTAWGTMIIHREDLTLGPRSKAVRGAPKSIYLVNDNNLNRALLEGDTVYVIQNGMAVAWDGSVPI